jgi:hypothetical protein
VFGKKTEEPVAPPHFKTTAGERQAKESACTKGIGFICLLIQSEIPGSSEQTETSMNLCG